MNGSNGMADERDAFIDEIKRLESELIERDKNCASYKEQLFDLQQVISFFCFPLIQIIEFFSLKKKKKIESL